MLGLRSILVYLYIVAVHLRWGRISVINRKLPSSPNANDVNLEALICHMPHAQNLTTICVRMMVYLVCTLHHKSQLHQLQNHLVSSKNDTVQRGIAMYGLPKTQNFNYSISSKRTSPKLQCPPGACRLASFGPSKALWIQFLHDAFVAIAITTRHGELQLVFQCFFLASCCSTPKAIHLLEHRNNGHNQ